jgi:hypothetical protein
MKKLFYIAVSFTLIFSSCKKDEVEGTDNSIKKNDIPEFFKEAGQQDWGVLQPNIIKLSSVSSRISQPTDLAFNPTRDGELWITNRGTENSGGSTVMITALNSGNPVYDYRKDQNSWHFMSLPTGLAFGANGDWATSTGVLDANHAGGTFTGPALWSGDLNIYARPSGGNGSHLDMLHGSPFCMGIAWERGNVYWTLDGYNRHLCRYDFAIDHGPGNADHDDGKIQRFMNVSFTKNGDLPSHLILDEDKDFLYMVDGGKDRVLKVDLKSSSKVGNLPLRNEILADHSQWDADYSVVSEGQLSNYCGIVLNDNRLFLGDYDNGNILCIDLNTNKELGRIETGIEGMTGLDIYNNEIYFVSYNNSAVYKVIAR